MPSAARAPQDHNVETSAAASPAIDLVHLGQQCLGDKSLEMELLALFDRQAARIADELTMPDLADHERAERCDLAHTLKGSAQAVGAWRVAEAAAAYEKAAPEACRTALGARAADVQRCVKEARDMIGSILTT